MRERLFPRGENALLIAAYAVILAALITFILWQPDLPTWRFAGAILALAALLVLYVIGPDLEARWDKVATSRAQLLLGAALFLAAIWLGQIGTIFYVLFLLTGHAFADLRLRPALLYSLAVTGGWFALFWGLSHDPRSVLFNLLSIGSGMLFTALFTVGIRRYGEQTARAEALLAELRRANAELAAARERERDLAVAEERVRLTQDIHDGLGHHLTVLTVQLQAAAKLVRRDPERAEDAIAICREEARAALDEVRGSVAALRRSPLDGRTLDEALPSLVRDFARGATLAAHFRPDGNPIPLPPAAAMTLYRAAQEGLTNAQKHAAADRVTVTLRYDPASVSLAVEDDGAGSFPTHRPAREGDAARGEGTVKREGFGLRGLRERAEQLGGALVTGTGAEGGFRLELSLPLAPGSVGGAGDEDSP